MAKKTTLEKNIRNQTLKNQRLVDKGEQPKVYNLLENIDEKNNIEKQYSTCEKCGKTFEQEYQKHLDRYHNFKTCHECRWEKNKKKSKDFENQEEYSVATLRYSPYPWQEDFEKQFEKTRFGVIAGGARSGKDFMSVTLLIKYATYLYNEFRIIHTPTLVPSFRIWIIAPIEKIARQNWQQLTKFFPKEWVVATSDSTMVMQVIGGGIIEVRSAYAPEQLVGVAVDFCVITEAARISRLDEVWGNIEDRLNSPKVGLKGEGGKAIINSSPLGKNFFYKMWTWGNPLHDDYSSEFFSVQIPSTANPEVAERYAKLITIKNGEQITYEESLRRRKGKKFLQDNLAQFIDAGGTVFPNLKENCVIDIYRDKGSLSDEEIKEYIKNWQEPKVGMQYRVGYDPASGSSGDNPAVVVLEKETNRLVKAISLYGIEGEAQVDRVAYIAKQYNYAEVCALTTGSMHLKDRLEKRGVTTIDVGEQGLKKRSYVEALQTAVSSKDLKILDDGTDEITTLIFQMEDYTESKTGKFGNKVADNDDYVSALYAVFFDYLSVEPTKHHYIGKISGLKRRNRNGMFKR